MTATLQANGHIGKIKPKRCQWNYDKCLIATLIILILLLLVCLALIIYFATVKEYVEDDSNICHNEGCTSAAFALLSGMDWSVDPCDDFYSHMCADFIRKRSSSYKDTSTSVFRDLQETQDHQLKVLLEHEGVTGEPDVMNKIREMYKICINTSGNSEEQFHLFKTFVENILDKWPMEEGFDWEPTKQNFGEYLGTLMSYNVEAPFFHIHLKEDPEDASKYIPQIELGMITTLYPDENYIFSDSNIRKPLRRFMNKLMKLFKNDNDRFILEDFKLLAELHEYMKELHEFHQWSNESAPEEKMTINELYKLTDDEIDWLKLLNKKFHDIHVFTGEDEVNVRIPELLKEIQAISHKFRKRITTNAIIWNAIYPDMIMNAGDEALRIYQDFRAEIDENYELLDRPYLCREWVKKYFPDVITRIFVDNYIGRDSKEKVEEILELIKAAYVEKVKTDEWKDEEKKSEIIEQLTDMLTFVAFDEDIFDNEVLDEQYAEIIVNDDHFTNFLQMNDHLNKHEMGMYLEPVNKSRYTVDFYREDFFDFNEGLEISARILQEPYFDHERLAAVNFATLGTRIAKIISSLYESEGVLFPFLGNYEDISANDTLFNNRSRCLIEQYSSYCFSDPNNNETNECLDGFTNYEHNFIDNLALKIAFDAYHTWVEKHGDEKRLVKLLQFTPEQVFFLAYGNVHCEYSRKSDELEMLKAHITPLRFRVIGVLANDEDFRDAFNCPEGRMNRGSDTCII